MRLTIVGCGDAFGTGGRVNTCFLVEAGGATLALDFGASSLPAVKRLGRDPDAIDAVVLSHLHGDHFGGLPFLVLDAMYVARRTRPLRVVGPPGTRARLEAAMEALFPGSWGVQRRFDLEVTDLPCGVTHGVAGFDLVTTEVRHPSGAPSTAVRLRAGGRTLAYSGDTEWTEALVKVARGADLFICECYGFEPVPWHLDYRRLTAEAPRLAARRVLLTHLGPTMIGRQDAVDRARFDLAEDGLVLDV